MLSFADAVTTCVVRKPLTFRGRAPRSEFWWFYLATLIGYLIASLIAGLFMQIPAIGTAAGVIILLAYGIAAFVLMLSASVRRLHDTGRSGWWLAGFACISVIFSILGLALLDSLLGLVLFIFYLLPGTKGPNRFGPDPLAPAEAPVQPQPSVQLPGADGDFTKLGR